MIPNDSSCCFHFSSIANIYFFSNLIWTNFTDLWSYFKLISSSHFLNYKIQRTGKKKSVNIYFSSMYFGYPEAACRLNDTVLTDQFSFLLLVRRIYSSSCQPWFVKPAMRLFLKGFPVSLDVSGNIDRIKSICTASLRDILLLIQFMEATSC